MVLAHAPKCRHLRGVGARVRRSHLILARVLPTSEYGLFTLVIALVNLSYALAPAGIDGMVNRRHLEAGPSLFRRTAMAGAIVGIVFVAIAELSYHISLPLLLVVFASTVGAARWPLPEPSSKASSGSVSRWP